MTNEIEYKVIDGTSFHKETDEKVCKILNEAMRYNFRIRLFYGDTETGRDWNEEYDTLGYIGRSTGTHKIPLLIPNSRSTGGGAVLDNCIVKITHNGCILYRSEKYNTRTFIVRGNYVIREGEEGYYALCKNEKSASRLASFMNGTSNSK